MFSRYLNFIRGISVNWYGRLGVVFTTSSFIILVIFEVARMLGVATNAYLGLVTYLLFPTLFILGLILIPIGWRRFRKQTGKSSSELLDERFDPGNVEGGFYGSKLFLMIGFLTIVNILLLGTIAAQMHKFMDGSEFCGTACHSVMNPEWTTYKASPHAHVKCVQCHVGEGAEALFNSKMNGIWQMISVTFDLYDRPIPTPVHQLRPARETCEKCHWPDKFYGRRLKTRMSYQHDENSTPSYTTLSMKIDTGKGSEEAGIHWHIGRENKVRYTSVDDRREEILWVEVLQPDGSYHRYSKREASRDRKTARNVETSLDKEASHGGGGDFEIRTMDCVDCHNRATHIYEAPGKAVDERIRLGLMDRSLPYLKREALDALTNHYPDRRAALSGIENHIYGFYRRHYPQVALQQMELIDAAVQVVQSIYLRNIHQEMNIGWEAYPSHIGHIGNGGCFRCHDPELVDEEGRTISHECTLCHSILSFQHDEPFEFLQPADTTSADYPMHRYLKEEFLDSFTDR